MVEEAGVLARIFKTPSGSVKKGAGLCSRDCSKCDVVTVFTFE
jgi:hypothetical protein